MKTSDVHPDNLLQSLLANNPRSDKAKKLLQLHEICTRQHTQDHVQRDFTLASIGRLCKSHGIFKTERTLYNSGSEDYCTLINAWAAYSGPAATKSTSRDPKLPTEYQFLSRIEDHAIRSLMQCIISERDKLKQQLDILKSQVKFTVDRRPTRTVSDQDVLISRSEQLTDSERSALQQAIAVEFIEDHEWRIGEDGEIYAENGALLFEPGFVTAVRKILGQK